mgnify:CR=1 FL=1
MAIIKCKMCGGDLTVEENSQIAVCEYCGTQQTVPKQDNEKKLTLFARANRLRFACEFDKAAGVYESIVAEFPEEAEAYWGLVLCKYGIEYVDDPATDKKVPTCHRSSFESVLDDTNFELVIEYADVVTRKLYREETKAIEELRRGIIEVSSREEPYDIFICYKETDENGQRTLDSVLAQDLYDALTEKGYRVFFSRITLEDKLGQEYEPYIFAALNSARVMLAVGTDYEYYNAPWVKNEWSRYLQLIAAGQKKSLIPCYKNIDAYDMPKEFAKLQAQDLGKVGATQDLLRGIEKIMGKSTAVAAAQPVSVATAAYTERGLLFLEDGDFVKANDYFERALDQNPRDWQAYLGKVFAALHISTLQEMEKLTIDLDRANDYTRAIQFAPASEQGTLLSLRDRMQWKYAVWQLRSVLVRYKYKKERAEKLEQARLAAQRQQEEYDACIRKMHEARRIEELSAIADTLQANMHPDANHLRQECLKRINTISAAEDIVQKSQSALNTFQQKQKARLSSAQVEMNNTTAEIARLKSKIAALQEELAAAGLFAGAKKRRLRDEINSLLGRQQFLEQTVEKTLAECRSLKEQEAELRAALQTAKVSLSEAQEGRV